MPDRSDRRKPVNGTGQALLPRFAVTVVLALVAPHSQPGSCSSRR